MRNIVLLFIVIFSLNKLYSQNALFFSKELVKDNLNYQLQFYNDSDGNLEYSKIDSILRNQKKKTYPNILNFGLHKGNTWIRFNIKNPYHLKLYLTINNPQIDSLVLYTYVDNKLIKNGIAGDRVLTSDWSIKSNKITFPLDFKKKDTQEYILKIKKNGTLRLPISILSANDLIIKRNKSNLISGVYFGVYILLFIISLSIFILYKKSLFLLYSIYVFSFFNLTFIEFGYGYLYLWNNELFDVTNLRIAFGVLSSIATLLFSVKLLNINIYFKKLNRVINIWSVFFICSYFILSIITPLKFYYLIVPIYFTFLIINALLVIVSAINSIKRFKRESIYIISSIVVMFFGVLTLILLELNYISFNYYTSNSVAIASLIDIIILAVTIAFKLHKIYIEKLTLQEKLIRNQVELLTARIKGEEKERKRISRELHDGVSSHLVALNLKMENTNCNNEVRQLSLKALNEVRNISHRLFPPDIEQNLKDILMNYANTINIDSDIFFQLFFKGDLLKLNQEYKISIFRIIQELISNAIKHSKAKKVFIQIIESNDSLIISYEDDGIGVKHNSQKKGIGIKNIESRIIDLKGILTFDFENNTGYSLYIELPI